MWHLLFLIVSEHLRNCGRKQNLAIIGFSLIALVGKLKRPGFWAKMSMSFGQYFLGVSYIGVAGCIAGGSFIAG